MINVTEKFFTVKLGHENMKVFLLNLLEKQLREHF